MPFDGANYDTPVSNPVTNPVTELLEQAWSLIDKPQKWCRGQPEAANGRRLCSMAALQITTWHHGRVPNDAPYYITALSLLGSAMGRSVTGFNDSHSHRQVATAWQRAIALSRCNQRESRTTP